MVSYTNPSASLPPKTTYELSQNELSKELFLRFRLVETMEDLKKLMQILRLKKIGFDEPLVFQFAYQLESALIDQTQSLREEETEIFFSHLIDLIRCEDVSERIAEQFYACFACTSRYHYKTRNRPLHLPLKIHLRAFEACKFVLDRHSSDSDVARLIFRSLIHIIDHKDFPADLQMELMHLVRCTEEHFQIEVFYNSAIIEHATPLLRSTAVEFMQNQAKDLKNPEDFRKEILHHLTFLPLRIDEEF